MRYIYLVLLLISCLLVSCAPPVHAPGVQISPLRGEHMLMIPAGAMIGDYEVKHDGMFASFELIKLMQAKQRI